MFDPDVGFIKCHVINLDRSPDRLRHVARIFSELGLGFERVAAVDGGSLSDEEYQHLTSRLRWPRELSRNEVGCFLSHRQCLRLIAEGDAPWGAVFEDDIEISPHIRCLLKDASWIPEGVDIVKLDTTNKRCTAGRPRLITAGSGAPYRLGRLLSTHYGTGGYIVSKQCAKKLCTHMEYVRAPVDVVYFKPDFGLLRELNVQQMIPAPVSHLGLVSTIGGHRSIKKDHVPWRRKPIREVRRVYRRHISPLWLTLTRGCRTGKVAFQ